MNPMFYTPLKRLMKNLVKKRTSLEPCISKVFDHLGSNVAGYLAKGRYLGVVTHSVKQYLCDCPKIVL